MAIRFAQISISSGLGQLSMHTEPGRLKANLYTKELKMQNEHPAVQLDITHPRVRIDQTECFNTSGLKTCHRQAMDYFAKSEQIGKSVAGKIAEDGKEFVRIERHGKPIQAQARRIWAKDPHLTVVSMPTVPPRVTLERGSVNVSLAKGDSHARFDTVTKPGSFEQATVRGRWLQAPYIQISVIPGHSEGRILDTLV